MRAPRSFLAAALLGALPIAAQAPGAPMEIGVASALEKLRPDDPPPRGRAIELAAARGECEAAQVAVRSSRGIATLSARLGALEGRGRVQAALYRVATVPLARPSGPDGAAGEWPDPLVPERDDGFGEARRAFPVDVAPGKLQAIWVEVCVPDSTAPGRYASELEIREGDRRAAAIPVRLTVWPFAIPATSTLPVTFGLSTILGTRALGAPGDAAVARALAAAALRHRVTPHGLSMEPPAGGCDERGCHLDFTAYDAEMGPILDGELVPGARGTFAEVRLPAALWNGPDGPLVAALRAWSRHFAQRGWSDRLWLYTLDEPRPADLPELVRRARAAHTAGVRVFATTLPSRALAGLIDVYAPNLVAFEGRRGEDFTARGPRGAGRPFWYASCMSHGCGELPETGPSHAIVETFGGWPGYEIDRPGTSARAMGWLAFREGVAGELYYDMLQAWRGDPWRDVRAFAGNGDGTLLYPGLPKVLGGTHPFPVESIRLKIIRDGLEDYELLALAVRSGHRALAERLAAEVVPSPRRHRRDPAAYLEARRRLGEALARTLAAR